MLRPHPRIPLSPRYNTFPSPPLSDLHYRWGHSTIVWSRWTAKCEGCKCSLTTRRRQTDRPTDAPKMTVTCVDFAFSPIRVRSCALARPFALRALNCVAGSARSTWCSHRWTDRARSSLCVRIDSVVETPFLNLCAYI